MRTVARWISRALWGAVIAILLVVAVGAYLFPETTDVNSNSDGIEWRPLNVPTTTTTAKPRIGSPIPSVTVGASTSGAAFGK